MLLCNMFTLVKMKDAIPIPADKLDKPRAIAVSHQIEEKYCNRVLLDIGLCICLYEMLEVRFGMRSILFCAHEISLSALMRVRSWAMALSINRMPPSTSAPRSRGSAAENYHA